MMMTLDPARWLLALMAVLGWLALCLPLLAAARQRQMTRSGSFSRINQPDQTAAADTLTAPTQPGASDWLVLYASQTGNAALLAQHTTAQLQGAGLTVRCLCLSQIDASTLASVPQALFIVSTCGEGDAPDDAARFVFEAMQTPARLPQLGYAVLALGDRSYTHFCGFGQHLAQWLHASGASALFPLLQADRSDPLTLARWRQHIGNLAGESGVVEWDAAPFEDWCLQQRRLLNPGSAGAPVYELRLAPRHAALPQWEAGDLVQICAPSASQPANLAAEQSGEPGQIAAAGSAEPAEPVAPVKCIKPAGSVEAADHPEPGKYPAGVEPVAPRSYSIASLTSEGHVRLLVRLHQRAQGGSGLASGWLCQQARPGDRIALRVRAHPRFRLADNVQRPLICIGNGTGLAGMRAHLKQRIDDGRHDNWLIFGERHAAHDFLLREELQHWLQQGQLAALDCCFSRDGATRRYVQHALAEHATRLRDWVSRGAAIYVCGSLQGMAGEVHSTLQTLLGSAALAQLQASGRYRRDVY